MGAWSEWTRWCSYDALLEPSLLYGLRPLRLTSIVESHRAVRLATYPAADSRGRQINNNLEKKVRFDAIALL